MHFVISTDGACKHNPGAGGYCGVLWVVEEEDGITIETPYVIARGGIPPYTTNNAMEVQAVLEILKKINGEVLDVILFLKADDEDNKYYIKLYTDSTYVRDSISKTIIRWVKEGWVNVPNGDLWQKVLKEITRLYNKGIVIDFQWVKAHNGDYKNEYVDKVASEEAFKQKIKAGL